jgi:hypothetical protein
MEAAIGAGSGVLYDRVAEAGAVCSPVLRNAALGKAGREGVGWEGVQQQ